MSIRRHLRNLTAEEVQELTSKKAKLGATEFEITQQSDGKYALSFLPGDDDFPTEDQSK